MYKNRFAWAVLIVVIAVVAGVALAQYNEHIHDPWIEPGVMQAEQEVGLDQHEQLQVRLLTGQADR
ncbi:MAG TPA: hypothetical protein VK110_03690 [Salinisphaeraceae bacterium]|nr:hypothetical protein [Salinisphaeraceae bacterium]